MKILDQVCEKFHFGILSHALMKFKKSIFTDAINPDKQAKLLPLQSDFSHIDMNISDVLIFKSFLFSEGNATNLNGLRSVFYPSKRDRYRPGKNALDDETRR